MRGMVRSAKVESLVCQRFVEKRDLASVTSTQFSSILSIESEMPPRPDNSMYEDLPTYAYVLHHKLGLWAVVLFCHTWSTLENPRSPARNHTRHDCGETVESVD
jgi:hypothetical protein